MIIQSINNIIKYDNRQILNLMESPSPDSDDQLFEDYYNFIDAVDVIYGTQDPKTGLIPVFKTIFDNSNNRNMPDKSSTLHFLVPGNSYLIKIKANSTLPIRLPAPLSLMDFIMTGETETANNCGNSCCPILQIDTKTVSLSSANTHYINASIINAKSNEKYYYEFEPVFSNWPAEISPISGEILIPPSRNGVSPSGNIQAVFRYAQSLLDDIDSIPYVVDKNINASYYTNNIFTILKLKLFDSNCVVYDDLINISCRSCVDRYACPTITLNSTGSSLTRYISVNVSNLQPNTEYSYKFDTASSNCAANISPSSGLIINDRNSTSGTIYAVFKFCDNTSESSDCNLSSTNIFVDPILAKKIFHNLSFSIKTNDSSLCENITESIELTCTDCFGSFDTNLTFSLPRSSEGGSVVRDRTYYPYPLLDNIAYTHFTNTLYRPELEHVINDGQAMVNNGSSGLLIPCCEKSIPLTLNISNAVPGDSYFFDVYSYPSIEIIPSTGNISFSSGSGSFIVLANARGELSSSIHAVLTHEKSNKQASACTIVSCVPTGLYEAAAEAASRHPSGWYMHT